MQTLTCSVPSNINPLQTNGFLFSINKYPNVNYFCQEVNLPSIDLPAAQQFNPLVDIFHPGDKISFGDLSVSFLVDEDMGNWRTIYEWMKGLGFPKDHNQFESFITNNKDFLNTDISAVSTSDATLQILNSANNAAATLQFYDVFPINLSSLTFQSTTNETSYFVGQATFKFTLYDFI
jgi:hypothetical protein